MIACPNCRYCWPDDHTGQCTECGNPMTSSASNNQDLQFRFAKQIQEGVREGAAEFHGGSAAAALRHYSAVPVKDAIIERARGLIVQREEVRYEDDAA